MLGAARARLASAGHALHRAVLGDVAASLRSFGRLAAIVAPYNFLAQFPPSELSRVIESVERSLADGGVFAFDLLDVTAMPWATPPYTWRDEEVLRSTTGVVEYMAEGAYEPSTRLHTITEMWR